MFTVHNRRVAAQALSRTQRYLTELSLQGRFLLIMGVSSLILTLLLWEMFDNFTGQLLERIGERFAVEQSLYDKARALQPLMREMASAKQSAASPLLKKWAANERDPLLYGQSIDELRNRFGDTNFFVAIAKSGNFYYYDAARSQRQPLRLTLNPAEPDDVWIFDFIKSGDDCTVKVLTNKKLGVIKLWAMTAIRDGNRVAGVVGTGINLYDFTRTASSIHLPGVTNIFIDHHANIQVYNDVTHFDFPTVPNLSEPEHVHLQIVGPETGNQWLQYAIHKLDREKQGVETEFVFINGKRYLAGLIAIPELGWYDLTLLDLSVLLPQAEFTKMVLAIFAGTLGLLAILAFSLHKLVLKPVSTLTNAIARIRRGDFSSKPLEAGGGEVRELMSQFQHMAGTIYSTQQWLEDEIEKRTRQLSDARRILEISLHHERDARETQANLMALMAHEMRSPVAVIGNTAQMLNMLAQADRPDLLPRIEKITRSVTQLATLMDNFLTEKWLDMDKQGLNRVTGDLNRFCADAAGSFSENFARPIRVEPVVGDARLCADWQLVQIAVSNLLDNARKYSSLDSEIRLKVLFCSMEMLCIEVSDQGMGIPAELQPHIFDKFARGRHEADIQGSGLGLYLVNWIARFHGGYTEVSSIEGQGSTFRMCLPKC
ncbi:MAG: HAMP domain-containing sensor histidine kinase [Sideroxyarcus sp.]